MPRVSFSRCSWPTASPDGVGLLLSASSPLESFASASISAGPVSFVSPLEHCSCISTPAAFRGRSPITAFSPPGRLLWQLAARRPHNYPLHLTSAMFKEAIAFTACRAPRDGEHPSPAEPDARR